MAGALITIEYMHTSRGQRWKVEMEARRVAPGMANGTMARLKFDADSFEATMDRIYTTYREWVPEDKPALRPIDVAPLEPPPPPPPSLVVSRKQRSRKISEEMDAAGVRYP